MQPTRKIDPMKTWPVTELPKGQQPPSGRLQRSTRLRKKFYKWWIQKIIPPFSISEAVDYMAKHATSCNWSIVDRAMKTMEESFRKMKEDGFIKLWD